MKELNGKRVGVLSESGYDTHVLKHMLEREAVEGVQLVSLGEEYGRLAPFINGRIDAGFMLDPTLTLATELDVVKTIARAVRIPRVIDLLCC